MNPLADPPRDLSTWDCHAGDVAFTITAEAEWLAAQRAYLAGFLTTPPREVELGGFGIRVHTDDAAFHEIVKTIERVPTAGYVEPVPGVLMREAHHPAGRRCYTIITDTVEHQPGAYAVSVCGRHLELFTHSGTLRSHRYPIRLIREAMLRTYEDAGGVVFHAAGVDLGGAGVMVCGPRGAGKTTVTAALLRLPGAALLSNDRLIIYRRDRAVAVPLPVPTGRGTIEAFPELEHRVRASTDRGAALDTMPPEFGSTVKHAFTARQFAEAFGAGLASASTVRQVVVARLTDTDQPAHVHRLAQAQARQIVAANCFTPRDEFWVRPWVIPRQRTDEQLERQAGAAIQRIAATLPCVELTFGVRSPITDLAHALDQAARGIR